MVHATVSDDVEATRRGHLRVVDAPKFSALPHTVLFNTDLSQGARLLYAVLQTHWWQGGECWASHATLATEMGCSLRALRAYLDELMKANLIHERAAGGRRSKVYTSRPMRHNEPIEDVSNEQNLPTEAIQSAKNGNPIGKKRHVQSAKFADSIEEDSGKKTLEEDTGEGVAANAAPQPAKGKRQAGKSRTAATACPETFPLDEKHFTYATSLGLSQDRARAETDKFLAHHRFKGTRGVDWYSGWQNWMRRAVTFDAQQPTPNGASPRPNKRGLGGTAGERMPVNVRRY